MNCSKHFLGLNWTHHEWERQVTRAQSFEGQSTDMWGRQFDVNHVICHTRFVCSGCGKVVDGAECTCEPERGERCAIRLAFLASRADPAVGRK